MPDKHTHRRGLTSLQVQKRFDAGQTNGFTQKTSRSALSIIRANTFTLFNAIIGVCFLILILIGHWRDIFFALAALSNAIIGSIQEFRAKRALDKLALLNAHQVTVVRNGKEQLIAVANIVIDDVLVLRAGDEVPADAEVAEASSLQVDQSMLTGESDPIDRNLGDEVLSGSVVVAGYGYAIVTKVGEHSFANRFASEARRFSLVSSELRNSINKVLKFVTYAIGPVILLLINSQIMTLGGWGNIANPDVWQRAVVSTIASIVAMIPLGLVLITSVSFAIGAVRLTRQKVLVKELAAVEGLARVDMICLDKTGTLTEGTISYKQSYELSEEFRGSDWQTVLGWYAHQPGSNATARSLGITYKRLPRVTSVQEIEFSSARKWSAVGFDASKIKGTWVLGGPDMVFPDGQDKLHAKSATLARQGYRTLVLAYSPNKLDTQNKVLPVALQPVALLSFEETIRQDAAVTLTYFKEQAVQVRIISGDNPETVAAIARRVGLDVDEGYDARNLPDDDAAFAEVLRTTIVFGRVTPEQKQRMVVTLQSLGHIVAMTGDGVNDTLAIKQADIGIAMNSGSAAAKAVARLVLLDGQFSHLPGVVDEGRQVIANIERISMIFLSKTTYAFGLAIVLSLLVLPFPFLPRQESIVDGLTIGIPAFFLALLPNKKRYQPGFLKRSLSFAIPAGLVVTAVMATYAKIGSTMGIGEKMLQTGATLLLIFMGLWILIALSRPLTIIKTAIIGAMMIGLVLVLSIPLLTSFLGFSDVSQSVASLVTALTFVGIILIELVRVIHTRIYGAKQVQRKKLTELTIISVIAYLSAAMMIVVGILFVFARYIPDISTSDQTLATYLGVLPVMVGFLTMSVATGVSRGDGASRILLTVLLSFVAVIILSAIILDEQLSIRLILSALFILTIIIILWTGRRRLFFRSGSKHLK